MGGYYQNHVDNNIVFFRCNRCYLFVEHSLNYVLIKQNTNFMFNGITNEAMVIDEIIFIYLFATSFIIKF
jgi:hypothetical protein